MEYILVSACLLGDNTKYNGLNNYTSDIHKLEEYAKFIKVCPEMDGGLSCPRNPSEIIKDKVVSNKGIDVTAEYNLGASRSLEMVKKYNIKYAVLKEKSPSCGVHQIYDGTFSGTKIPGMGVTTKLLVEAGVMVFSENEIDELVKILKD